MNTPNEPKRAGFWLRLLATWVDCLIIYAVLTAVFYLFVYTAPQFYFPFNFTFFITGMLYTVILTGVNGQTVGKYLLNIEVCSSKGGRLPFYKIVLRETLLKAISAIFLFLGFLWIGFSQKKMGWQDYGVGSKVVQNKKQLQLV